MKLKNVLLLLVSVGLIAAREKELADAQGRGGERPYYADASATAQLVSLDVLRKPKE